MNDKSNQTTTDVLSKQMGLVPYLDALQLQKVTIEQVRNGGLSTIYWLEHPPVITIGRNGTSAHILLNKLELQERGIQVVETDRGGDVTVHAPGQLVVYPILDLAPWNHDIERYVRGLEEVVIRTLAAYGITAGRRTGFPGVWIKDAKICAIGAKANRYLQSKGYVMSHGFALNVDIDLSYFSYIVPCGITDKAVTSLKRELIQYPSMHQLQSCISQQFEDVFQIRLLPTFDS